MMNEAREASGELSPDNSTFQRHQATHMSFPGSCSCVYFFFPFCLKHTNYCDEYDLSFKMIFKDIVPKNCS